MRNNAKVAPSIVKRISVAMVDTQPSGSLRYEPVHEERPLDAVDGCLCNRVPVRVETPTIFQYNRHVIRVDECPSPRPTVTTTRWNEYRLDASNAINVVPLTVIHAFN